MSENQSQSANTRSNLPPAALLKREETSSERNFRVYENSWWLRFKRDIRILIYLAKLFKRWFIFGGRFRKAWKKADKTGKRFVLEDIMQAGK